MVGIVHLRWSFLVFKTNSVPYSILEVIPRKSKCSQITVGMIFFFPCVCARVYVHACVRVCVLLSKANRIITNVRF